MQLYSKSQWDLDLTFNYNRILKTVKKEQKWGLALPDIDFLKISNNEDTMILEQGQASRRMEQRANPETDSLLKGNLSYDRSGTTGE